MTQTEKTEAIRELRHWFEMGILTTEQKAVINKELAKILDTDTDVTIADSVAIILTLGGELHYREYVLLKDDLTWYSLINSVTSETERSSDYKILVDKILKERTL